MLSIFNHLLLFFQISLMSLIISLSGFILKKFLFNENDKENFEENGLFGFISIGFFALILNFITPLSLVVNNVFLFLLIITGIILKFFNQNIINLLTKIFIISSIAYLFLIYSNNNRPDAFLYHLPYSRILNENKIIFGLSNLHFRFGHISIFQYISSFFVNNIFSIKGLIIPISLVTSYFLIFCYRKFNIQFSNINSRLNSYIIFFLLIISIYSFSRYSAWGNDAQVHIFYFLMVIYLLDYRLYKNDIKLFYKISIIGFFTFLIKPFYLISLFLPLIFFIGKKNKLKIITSKTSIFIITFFIFWLLKNFIITSCLIYPIKTTCVTTTKWYNNNTLVVATEGEAWAKDWINRKDKSINHEQFKKNFVWFNTWKNNHFKIIIEKLLPVILFIIVNIFLIFFTKSFRNKIDIDIDKYFLLLFFFNFISVALWFLKFPLFRYGISFIYSFIVFSLYFIFLRYIDLNKISKLKKTLTIFIIISFVGLFLKNTLRIYSSDNLLIHPPIYENNSKSDPIKFYNKTNDFYFIKLPIILCVDIHYHHAHI